MRQTEKIESDSEYTRTKKNTMKIMFGYIKGKSYKNIFLTQTQKAGLKLRCKTGDCDKENGRIPKALFPFLKQ